MEQLAILGFESIRVVARRVRTVEVNIHPPEKKKKMKQELFKLSTDRPSRLCQIRVSSDWDVVGTPCLQNQIFRIFNILNPLLFLFLWLTLIWALSNLLDILHGFWDICEIFIKWPSKRKAEEGLKGDDDDWKRQWLIAENKLGVGVGLVFSLSQLVWFATGSV